MDLNDFETPLVMLGAVWVSAAPVLTAHKTLHSERDLILGIRKIEDAKPTDLQKIQRSIFLGSYLPLLGGVLLFLAVLTVIIWATGLGVDAKISDNTTPNWWSRIKPSWWPRINTFVLPIVAIPFFEFVGFLWSGLLDIKLMTRHLYPTSDRKDGATTDHA